MTAKAEYQHYARECLQWAARAKDEAEQRAFLEMADAWTRAALVQRDLLPTRMEPSSRFIPNPPRRLVS